MHKQLVLIAHFHNTINWLVRYFGYLAGFAFWFPKAMGFHLKTLSWVKRRSGG